MNYLNEIKKSFLTSLWFIFLTFPIMVIRVNTIEKTVEWRWINVLLIALGSFVLSFVWRFLMKKKQMGSKAAKLDLTLDIGYPMLLLMWFLFILLIMLSANIYVGAVFDFSIKQILLILILSPVLAARKQIQEKIEPFFSKFAYRINLVKDTSGKISIRDQIYQNASYHKFALYVIGIAIFLFPFVSSVYQTNILISALIWVMLGLGLNIVVGLAGLLDLGYVAFYAVGAYSYALLNIHYGINFWLALPIGGLLGAIFGILLGYPVLRLRGDYLAIVTLGFGEIIRLVLENWNDFSYGPSGIPNIPKPTQIPGFDQFIRYSYEMWDLLIYNIDLYVDVPDFLKVSSNLGLKVPAIYLFFIMILLTVFTIFIVNRLQNSRIGRAWIALREDEIACQAMGVDKQKTKLSAFAMGATWAGMAGVMFAAKTTFINPASFTIWESVMILCIVVLGGMGSILGVILGALVLILLPEYLRAFSEFRMLVFGASMIIMMIFRPGGIITSVRQTYKYSKS